MALKPPSKAKAPAAAKPPAGVVASSNSTTVSGEEPPRGVVVPPGSNDEDLPPPPEKEMAPPMTLLEIIQKEDAFSQFEKAINASGALKDLKVDGNITIFAPENRAFEKMGPMFKKLLKEENLGLLKDIVLYHVVPAKASSKAIVKALQGFAAIGVDTLEGQKFNITAQRGMLNLNSDAIVTAIDLHGTNGYMHVIDRVLTPPNMAAPVGRRALEAAPAPRRGLETYDGTLIEFIKANVRLSDDMSTLADLLDKSGLMDALEGYPQALTMFAPENSAFEAVQAESDKILSLLGTPAGVPILRSILQYHIAGGNATTSAIRELMANTTDSNHLEIPSAIQMAISIDLADAADELHINNDTNVTTADVIVSNGVVHQIDGLLLPPGLEIKILESAIQEANIRMEELKKQRAAGNITLEAREKPPPRRLQEPQTLTDIIALREDLTTLDSMLALVNLTLPLSTPGPFTVFAPTNDAFAKLDANLLELLQSPEGQPLLNTILQYHVLAGNATQEVIGMILKNVSNIAVATAVQIPVFIEFDNSTTAEGDKTLLINQAAHVTDPDQIAPNGIVHVIDEMLVPPGMKAQDMVALIKKAQEAIAAATQNATQQAAPPAAPPATPPAAASAVAPAAAPGAAPATAPTAAAVPQQGAASVVAPAATTAVQGQPAASANLGASTRVLQASESAEEHDVELEGTVAGIIAEDEELATLQTALEKTGLLESLAGEGPYTILAPTDAAFKTLGPLVDLLLTPVGLPLLSTILKYHIIPANATSDVLLEGTVAGIIAEDGDLTTLKAALDATDLLDDLANDGPFTFLAPTDEAFEALGSLVDLLLTPTGLPLLSTILKYHIIPANATSDVLVDALNDTKAISAQTFIQIPVIIKEEDGALIVNTGAEVVEADLLADNGVVHKIDKVLIPPGLALADLEKALEQAIANVEAAEKNGTNATEQSGAAESPDEADDDEAPGRALQEDGTNATNTTTNITAEELSDLPIPACLAALTDELGEGLGFSTFLKLLDLADLTTFFATGGPFTMFVPTDAAFAEVPLKTADLTRPNKRLLLQAVLKYHAVAANATNEEFVDTLAPFGAMKVQTLILDEIFFRISGETEGIRLNLGADILPSTSDVVCANGIVNAIDEVLYPGGLSGSLFSLFGGEDEELPEAKLSDEEKEELYLLKSTAQSVHLDDDDDDSTIAAEEVMANGTLAAEGVMAKGALTSCNKTATASRKLQSSTNWTNSTASEKTVLDVAEEEELSTLVEVTNVAKLTDTLEGTGPFTLFAPTDAAFKSLGSLMDLLLEEQNQPILQTILLYHVVPANATHQVIHQALDGHDEITVGTFLPVSITVELDGKNTTNSTLLLNSEAKEDKKRQDLLACNGVVHVIDKVLIPPGITLPTADDEGATPKESVAEASDAETAHDPSDKATAEERRRMTSSRGEFLAFR
ncbi:unnamed protein product [Vitrella brassicaformis CCMP3155]|uniref:FAS1 domain-containing protein n=1 Tax=Vitrella brassicaformis (strain CCMP3155) TaxID=1169540 RepID=A0A0G4E9Z2_VITBC|nr:unnamed protein product [Vitrella brassicaformis CCMP3155]|eukprot:CEL92265.1 unnamed protein product [Vitrella brassicaformis CCMP3155]